MFKSPFIKILIALNLAAFVCVAVVNVRGILRNRHSQGSAKVTLAELVDNYDKSNDNSGDMAYADSQRMHNISRYTHKNKAIADDDLNWLMSLMEKTFPNGRPYNARQALSVDVHLMYVKTFTPQQKEAVFQKCSGILANQASDVRSQNHSITQTCCQLFEQTKDQRAVSYLTPLLQNPDGRIKKAAGRTLTDLGHPVEVNIPNGGFGTLKNK